MIFKILYVGIFDSKMRMVKVKFILIILYLLISRSLDFFIALAAIDFVELIINIFDN